MASAGYLATIKISPSTVINDIKTYEVPLKMDMEDVTSFSSPTPGTKQFLPTLYGAQIKASGQWNKGDAGQGQLETAFFGRTKVTLIFSPNGTNTYTASCWISDYSIKAEVKGVIQADFTLQMDGAATPA